MDINIWIYGYMDGYIYIYGYLYSWHLQKVVKSHTLKGPFSKVLGYRCLTLDPPSRLGLVVSTPKNDGQLVNGVGMIYSILMKWTIKHVLINV